MPRALYVASGRNGRDRRNRCDGCLIARCVAANSVLLGEPIPGSAQFQLARAFWRTARSRSFRLRRPASTLAGVGCCCFVITGRTDVRALVPSESPRTRLGRPKWVFQPVPSLPFWLAHPLDSLGVSRVRLEDLESFPRMPWYRGPRGWSWLSTTAQRQVFSRLLPRVRLHPHSKDPPDGRRRSARRIRTIRPGTARREAWNPYRAHNRVID
jgi:hypothetical protein